MNQKITIAIVSDLHCRVGKEAEITTHLYTELARNPKPHHPVEALKVLIKEKNLQADLLLCPGDISDKADDSGLSVGWQFLKEIGSALKCSMHTATVGNHDVKSREKVSKTANTKDAFHYLTTFIDDYPIDNEILRSSFWQRDKNYYIFEDDSKILLNYNSAYSHTDEENAKISSITQDILDKIQTDLKQHTSNNKFKIALFHHHPKQYANIDQFYKDGDIIDRGDKLLDLLHSENFDLVIHGHKHIPKLDYWHSNLPVFCAGSFSSLMNVKDISGKNTFHIVTIEKSAEKAKGIITTWEFAKGIGWSSSTTAYFFPHLTGFGCPVSTQDLVTKIVNEVSKQQAPLIYYDSILQSIPEIQYLIPSEQDKISIDLLQKHDIEFIPSLKLGPRCISKRIT